MDTEKEAHLRSILKAISYRLLASIATAIIVFVLSSGFIPSLSKRITLSVSAGAIEAVAKMFCYYIHERMWSFISFGKKRHPLSSLPVDKPLTEEDMEEVRKKLKDLGYISED